MANQGYSPDPNCFQSFDGAHTGAPWGTYEHSTGKSSTGASWSRSSWDYADQARMFQEATQWFTANPEHINFYAANSTKTQFVIEVYLYLTGRGPQPDGYVPQRRPGHSTPPPFQAGGGGSRHDPRQAPFHDSTPPRQPPPRQADQNGQGSRKTQDRHSSGTRRNLAPAFETTERKKKRLFAEAFQWFKTWFTNATGTKEFVDKRMRKATETLQPAMSFYDNIKKKNKAFWDVIEEYEESSTLIIVPLDFIKQYWVHGFGILACLCMMSYVVHVINAFPDYMQAMKMVGLVLLCSGMNYFKCKTGTMLLTGLLVSGVLTYVPFDSYTELPDSKLCPCRVYQAMDLCMKAKTNKFVVEGWPLLDQVLQHCIKNRDGNMCKHLIRVSEMHVNYFYECLHQRVILDPNVIEQRAIAIPEYDTEKGDHTYMIKQFSEISESPELSVYALMNRMEMGHYLITNNVLSKYVDILAQTGEKTISYWRYIPIIFPSTAPVFTWLNLLADFFGVKNGPITRKTVLKALDYMTGISEKEKIHLMRMANGNLSSKSDIFYVPPSSQNLNLQKIIKPTKGLFYVRGTRIQYDRHPTQGLGDNNIELEPRCTDETTLKNLFWNMHSKCPLGQYCREAIQAHVTEHDTSLCPEKCTQKTFDSGCTAEIEKSSENEKRYLEQVRDCSQQLSESKSTIDYLQLKLEKESGYCKYDEEFFENKKEKSGGSEESFKEKSQRGSGRNNFGKGRKRRYRDRFSTFRERYSKEQQRSNQDEGRNSDKKSDQPKDPMHEFYDQEYSKIISQFNIWDYTWMLEPFTLLKIMCGAVATIFLICACSCALCMMKNKNDEPVSGGSSSRSSTGPAARSRESRSATGSQPIAASGQRPQTRSFMLELADGVSKLSDGLSWVTTPEMQSVFEMRTASGMNKEEIKSWIANGKGPARKSQRIAAQKPRQFFGMF
jgi:hypothetical protein